ncbi:hypothetical protein G6F57_008300 [Rhizopus arrhizus]|jgi:hypothetical protein|uniref:Uncharacterized protein n=3 Tax=Rhizopus TaxID=4842 RepID=I1CD49_RHIO9|nr:hypothetical protein RO3G_11090 [Rhizopus delemar RA 99-880]KAG0734119.1 hypothetical protein G6F23_012690 [Rhizopus arrhizus]KAG1045404.1 hypothetical protein G6F43_011276 [Rhizopus delemar]KAG0760647.1 hypothetical protein G6F24_008161 [Rhizopus arrhizus]KAG0782090.1 hypothetical protein G6F22_009267 [Rhizopus arrhizus]|eukprot:EIE86379.1 hypothetical protein RO3G_11090 [Rhizopus delemar RA 99-880]
MNSNIELISYAKLAEYDQARIDLPIRKYVLIANFLRRPKEELLEQQWFDSCLSKLDEEDELDNESQPPPLPTKEEQKENNSNVQLHAYYHFNHRNGFLVYTSNL